MSFQHLQYESYVKMPVKHLMLHPYITAQEQAAKLIWF